MPVLLEHGTAFRWKQTICRKKKMTTKSAKEEKKECEEEARRKMKFGLIYFL